MISHHPIPIPLSKPLWYRLAPPLWQRSRHPNGDRIRWKPRLAKGLWDSQGSVVDCLVEYYATIHLSKSHKFTTSPKIHLVWWITFLIPGGLLGLKKRNEVTVEPTAYFSGAFLGTTFRKNGTFGDADAPWIIDFYGERILGISHVEKFWMNLIELGYTWILFWSPYNKQLVVQIWLLTWVFPKIGEKTKMYGENNGSKPYEKMDDLGVYITPIFGFNTHINSGTFPLRVNGYPHHHRALEGWNLSSKAAETGTVPQNAMNHFTNKKKLELQKAFRYQSYPKIIYS